MSSRSHYLCKLKFFGKKIKKNSNCPALWTLCHSFSNSKFKTTILIFTKYNVQQHWVFKNKFQITYRIPWTLSAPVLNVFRRSFVAGWSKVTPPSVVYSLVECWLKINEVWHYLLHVTKCNWKQTLRKYANAER